MNKGPAYAAIISIVNYIQNSLLISPIVILYFLIIHWDLLILVKLLNMSWRQVEHQVNHADQYLIEVSICYQYFDNIMGLLS